jgi:hypothetical protein
MKTTNLSLPVTALALTFALGLTACGPGGNSTPAASAGTQPNSVILKFTIQIPANTGVASSGRAAQYISSDIQAIDFRLTAVAPTGGGTYAGALNTDTLIPLTYGSGNCSLVATVETCTATASAPAPASDTWTIYTYDTTTPAVGTTTPLSIYVAYTLPITLAGPNVAVVSTWGVPATLAFSPASVSNLNQNVALSGGAALTTSLQVKDAGGATIIGGNNFASPSGIAGSVQFTGCDSGLTPTPGTINAANPTALSSGNLNIAYSGLVTTAPTALDCYASAPGGLTAVYTVNLIGGGTGVNWSVN